MHHRTQIIPKNNAGHIARRAGMVGVEITKKDGFLIFGIGQNGRLVTHSSRTRRREILSQAQDDE